MVKALAETLGLDTLADIQVQAVRERHVPDRLFRRLADPATSALTKREREVMVLLASGYRRREIAEELGIGDETVKGMLKNVYRKLGTRNNSTVRNRIEAVNAFLEEEA